MERRLLLNVVISHRAIIFELLAGKDETLLIWRDTLLVLNLCLHVCNSVTRLYFKCDRLARQRLDKDLHLYFSARYFFIPIQ